MTLNASGVSTQPEALAPFVYIPERRGSLQTELIATARRHERLPYVIDPSLNAVAAELRAGRPVLVLQNLRLPRFPVWHYAVVVGMTGDRVLLRSGTEQRLSLRLSRFWQTWKYGGHWALVLLRPGEMPANPDPERWIAANTAFEATAGSPAVLANYESAARMWPEHAMIWLGLGNARYRAGQRAEAENAYRRAVTLDGNNAAALNNLAQTLADRGCREEALEQVRRARAVAEPALLPAVDETEKEIVSSNASSHGTTACTVP
jgi:tetratricopeptide (TPR) repeat protein